MFIPKEKQDEMIKAFKLLKKNKDSIRGEFSEIRDFIKEVSLSQSNLENIFIEVLLH